MNEDDVQPSGEYIETALEVVSHILSDRDFCADVIEENGWTEGLGQQDTAILFLASRFQTAVATLARQTDTLKRELDGIVVNG